MFPLIDQLGNWNPQLLRELKGRIKPSTVVLAIALSGIVQFLLLIYCYGRLPAPISTLNSHHYCTGKLLHLGEQMCVRDAVGNLLINWQVWWADTFVSLSLTGSFLLILVGVYLLANDVTQEEQRGTLNFIRLSPRATWEILLGKLLGVPVVLYLGVLLALPLHIWAALNGQVSIGLMLSFDLVTIAACLFFYSAGLLVNLALPKLGGLQVWCSSGVVFILLMFVYRGAGYAFPGNWLTLLSPTILLGHLDGSAFAIQSFADPQHNIRFLWFGFPFLITPLRLLAAFLLHYSVLTAWIWVALDRRFRTPSATLFSKRQSYGLVATLELIAVGFATQATPPYMGSIGSAEPPQLDYSVVPELLLNNFYLLMLFNLLGLLALAILLSPARQELQDWARYRRTQSQRAWQSLLQDLLWAENSPMLLTMAINIGLVMVMMLAWAASWSDAEYQKRAILTALLNAGVMLVCMAIAQVMLNSRLPKREFWAIGTVSGLIVLPPIAFMFAFANTSVPQSMWLFSAIPWVAVETVTAQSLLLTLLGHFSLFGLFSFRLSQQLRRSGASETKVLLSGTTP
ncbi:hypothetical protein IFO70_09545 [Phormidium tenue FACHB-886]|nr:hypothetical protein [Phormidium tenue FACHB-886]